MNDLEHDLREIFHQHSTDVDTPGLAPKDVLRRGRRRQVGIVVTGVLACLVALGVVAAAIGQARHPAVIPGGNGLPERTTSIGGVPVTAPAGWTLVDDWPLAAILPTTSQSCSFTSTGSAVSENGSPVDGGPPSSPPSSSQTDGQNCTTEQVGYGAGVPVLQLANFEVPVMETVCGLADQAKPAAIPDDGVAVYVADDQAQADIPGLLDACAGNGASPIGEPQVFFDVGHHTDYIGVAFAGPDASAADIDTARAYVDGLSGLAVTPTAPGSLRGPGYVVAAGSGGDVSWRMEAGISSFDRQTGAPNVGALMVTTTSGAEASRSVDLPTDGRVNDDSVDVGPAGVVQFGTATSAVTGIDIVSSSTPVSATLLRWPAGIRTLDAASGPFDGWLWFAIVPQKGDVRATLSTGPTTSPNPNQTSPPQLPAAEHLQTRTTADGLYEVFGNDFGHNWSFTQARDGSLMFSLDGAAPTQGYSFVSGSGTSIDIEGGALELNLEPASVSNVWVTSDVQGRNIVAQGRVAPPARYAPSPANIWVTALPGTGSGYGWSTDRELPLATSWPTAPNTTPGKIFAAGITDNISWTQTWSENGCPTFEVIASTATGDTGSVGCPVAWDARAYPHSVSYVGGVYGQHHAVILMTGPENMCAEVQAAGDPQAGPFCSSAVADVAPWSATGQAIFVIPVGETWTIQPTQKDGTTFGHPITITAKPGTIDLSGPPTAGTASSSGTATATMSP